jgi:hypothetical protein
MAAELSFEQQHWVQQTAYAPYRMLRGWIESESEDYGKSSGFSMAVRVGLAIIGWAERRNAMVRDVLLYVVAMPGFRWVLILEQMAQHEGHSLAALCAFCVWRKGVHKH